MASIASRVASASFDRPAFDERVLDMLPTAICVCDRDGQLLRYNRRAVELWGRAPELNSPSQRYCGSHKIFLPDGAHVPHAHCPMAEALRTGKAVDGFETVIERPDGERATCLVSTAPLRNADGDIVGAVACFQKIGETARAAEITRQRRELLHASEEITERKHAEQALQESEKRFRDLLNALPHAVYTTDAEGRITFYNQAAIDFSGRRPELSNDRWCVSWRLFWPDGTPLPHDECPMAIALREDRPIKGPEVIAERPDGTRVPFIPYPTPLHDSSGALVGAVNMLVDITDRMKAQQELKQLNEALERRVEDRARQVTESFARLHETEHRFRLLVEGVTDHAIFMLDRNGFVTNWNTGAERIKGYRADEITGQHFSRFYTAEDRQNGVPQQALATATRTGKYEAEGWRLRKNGSAFWASVVIDAIRDAAGQLVGFAKITRDLTEKRVAEEQIRQAQKMDAIGQLTGGVAHDFNNLLTAIIGNLEMLVTVLPPQERARRYAEAALGAASRGSRLTEHMLAFSRRMEIHPEIANINHLLRDIVMLCQRTVGEGVELVVRLQDDLWTCLIDSAQFEAAVLNLAANARDAMDRSGRITITTENVTAGGTNGVDLPAGEYVLLSMSDTGCGMSAAVLARAFEPFYTTKEVGKGTGLGLSRVFGFAKQSKGTARIESKTGSGTTVRIYLPRADGQVAGDVTLKESLSRSPTGTATVLVVEDDLDVRELVVGMLAHFGYRSLVATTGPDALAILRREKSVDILFSDIVLPSGMSGIELARTACRLRPGLRILLSSGYAGDTPAQAIEAEFPFIAKPYPPSALGQKLKDLLVAEKPDRVS